MKSWLHQLFAPQRQPAHAALHAAGGQARSGVAPTDRPPAAGPAHAGANATLGDQSSWDLALLAWMANNRSAFVIGPAGARERAAVQHLDDLLADRSAHHRLLPRAAAVIPPLLARLRSPDLSLADLTQHVSRDMALTTEVVRMVNSAHYRRDAAVVELDHAIRLLGVEGLRAAIARAVLKPLIDVRSGKLVASSAARLWEHTDRKAQLCSALARPLGFEPFEGCLAGLAHNTVWTAVLRTMDEIDGNEPWRLSPAFMAALGSRRDRLFGVVAQQWQLADGMAHVGTEVAEQDLGGDTSPAMRLLYTGDRLAWLLCSPDRAGATRLAEPMLLQVEKPVRACFEALQQADRH